MAKGDNPYDPNDEGPYSPLPTAGTPQVPISGNPYEIAGAREAPPPATLLGNAADIAKAASNTYSAGMRDRLEGLYRRYISGEAPSYSEGVNQALADTAMRRERSPYLSATGDVVGGVAQAYTPGMGAVGRSVSAALGGAGRGVYPAIARMTGYGVEGGLLGAAQAAGHTYSENPADYAKNALTGGAFGAALGAPFGVLADVTPRSTAPIPTSEQLNKSSSNRYLQTYSVPIEYSANQYRGALDAFEKRLYGITDPDKSKTVWHALNDARSGRLQADPNSPTVTPKDIDAIRQKLTGVKEPGAYQLREFLDVIMRSPNAQVKGGAAERDAIARYLTAARGDYRAAKRTQTIEDINQFAADKETDPAKALTNLLNPKSREGRWYTPEEKADIRSAANKDAIARAVQMGGNIFGGGGGPWGPAAYGGAGISGALATGDLTPLLTLGAPVVGMGLKAYGRRLANQSSEKLADTMAMRSPLYREWAAQSPVVAGPGLGNFSESARNAITNQLLYQLRLRGMMEGSNAP